MRKILMALAVMVVAIAVSAPHIASAAALKVSGFWRYRGITQDNADRDDTKQPNDSKQFSDALIRPRWTFTSLKGKIVALYELDFDSGFEFATSASSSDRQSVGTNRYTLDFAIPGTKARFRIGKTDWISPDKEIMASAGVNRIGGWGIRGKLSKSLRFEVWNTQINDGGAASSDDNDYFAGLTWTSPGLKISPWIAWEKFNGVSATPFTDTSSTVDDSLTDAFVLNADSTERDIWYYGVNVRATFGKIKVNVSGVLEDGTLDFGRGVNAGTVGLAEGVRQDTDIQAYIILIRSWLDLGRGLKVGFYGHFTPGDDDVTSATGDLGTQPDGKLTRFTAMKGGGACRLTGPQLFTRRRYNSVASGNAAESQCLNGDGGEKMNGAQVYEILFTYKVSKALTVKGNYSIIRSAASRSTIDKNFNGIEDAGDDIFGDAKDVGTEFDAAVVWNIYKGLTTTMSYAHLFAGDYGKSAAAGTRDLDDTWMLVWNLTHKF